MSNYLAVFVWSGSLAIVLQLGNVPPLYLAGLVGIMLGLWQGALEVRAGGFAALKVPAGAWLYEAAGIAGWRVLMYPALFLVDPIEAANLSQVWIDGILLCALIVPGTMPRPRQWLAAACFLAAVAASVVQGFGLGHVMALASGVLWVWYVLKNPHIEGHGSAAGAVGNLATGVLIIALAYIAGNRWSPDLADCFWLIALVLVAKCGLAFLSKGGGGRAAKVSVLFTPIVTVFWIVMLTGIAPDALDIFATLAVTAAGLLASPYVIAFKEARTAPLH